MTAKNATAEQPITDEADWEQQRWLEEYQQWIEANEVEHGSDFGGKVTPDTGER